MNRLVLKLILVVMVMNMLACEGMDISQQTHQTLEDSMPPLPIAPMPAQYSYQQHLQSPTRESQFRRSEPQLPQQQRVEQVYILKPSSTQEFVETVKRRTLFKVASCGLVNGVACFVAASILPDTAYLSGFGAFFLLGSGLASYLYCATGRCRNDGAQQLVLVTDHDPQSSRDSVTVQIRK